MVDGDCAYIVTLLPFIFSFIWDLYMVCTGLEQSLKTHCVLEKVLEIGNIFVCP